MANIFSIKIGGQAGQGVKSAGLLLAKVSIRSGYHIYNYIEYPSLIRGGHNVIQVCISTEEVLAPILETNLLIALDQTTIDQHLSELKPNDGIIFDEEGSLNTSEVSGEINLYPMPLTILARDASGSGLLKNTIALGGVIAFLGGSLEVMQTLIKEEFADKGDQVVSINQQAAQKGYDFVTNKFQDHLQKILAPIPNIEPKMVMSGNDAIALGAIAGGVQFAAIYPMSPISNILHNLAAHQEEYGYLYKQPEDEISAINMAIGAAFAGARSLTATSGGGFSLMVEGYGLAAMTETPLVIIEGMRPGPATGLPTWSGQGDLNFILHAHQDDFPRFVLAPGDAREAFDLTLKAFNLADKYQNPVIVLIDKNICENEQSLPIFNTLNYRMDRGKQINGIMPGYQRYAGSTDGVSPRALPGSGNFFITNSYEHDSAGFNTEKVADRVAQMKKRQAKVKTCLTEDLPIPELYGPHKADLTIVSWGSNKGSILQALKVFPNVNFLHLTWLSPFPVGAVRKILVESPYILDIECNFSGQLADLIKQKTGIEVTDKLLKYDGRPIYPEEIVAEINNILKK